MVPKYDSRWALMYINTFLFGYSHQNSDTVSLPGYKAFTLHIGTKWYLGTWSTQCLNATLFCVGAQAVVRQL